MKLKTKQIEATKLIDLETNVNTFLGTLDPKDVLDVTFSPFSSGKYGLTTTYIAAILFREA